MSQKALLVIGLTFASACGGADAADRSTTIPSTPSPAPDATPASTAVAYDVLFGGNPAYSDLSGTLVRSGDTWTITREEFCAFMASARTPCA